MSGANASPTGRSHQVTTRASAVRAAGPRAGVDPLHIFSAAESCVSAACFSAASQALPHEQLAPAWLQKPCALQLPVSLRDNAYDAGKPSDPASGRLIEPCPHSQ